MISRGRSRSDCLNSFATRLGCRCSLCFSNLSDIQIPNTHSLLIFLNEKRFIAIQVSGLFFFGFENLSRLMLSIAPGSLRGKHSGRHSDKHLARIQELPGELLVGVNSSAHRTQTSVAKSVDSSNLNPS